MIGTISPKHRQSVWTPRIDLGGCVLYLPLWRPSWDMIGNTIYSYDKNRYSCTVTDASWGRQGRIFGGISGFISLPAAAITNFLTYTVGTLEAWVNFDDTNTSAERFFIIQNATTAWGMQFDIRASQLQVFLWNTNVTAAVTGLSLSGTYHVVFTQDGSGIKIYLNTVLQTLTTDTFGSRWFDDIPVSGGDNPDTMFVGRRGTGYWKGTLIEIRAYNRALSVAEVQRNYLATKWRLS